MPGIIYLASPYSHEDKDLQVWRFEQACKYAAKMMRDGLIVFSPIAHTHPIAEAGQLPTDWRFWEKYDREMLRHCSRFVVLKLPGWEHSKGVQSEIRIAGELGLDIELVEPTREEG